MLEEGKGGSLVSVIGELASQEQTSHISGKHFAGAETGMSD